MNIFKIPDTSYWLSENMDIRDFINVTNAIIYKYLL